MKRYVSIVLALLLIGSALACAGTDAGSAAAPTEAPTEAPVKTVASEPTEAPTPESTETPKMTETPEPTATPEPTSTPEPPTEEATVLGDHVGAVSVTFAFGDAVTVTGTQGGYYAVATEEGEMLVEQWLIRLASEDAPAAYNAYSRAGTDVFRDIYRVEKIATLVMNTQITVVDAFGPVVRVVLADGSEGYTLAANVSRTRISGGGGGSSGGQDGGDIVIGRFGWDGGTTVRMGGRMLRDERPASGEWIVLAEGVDGYAAVFSAGDSVRVLERGAETCALLIDGRIGTVPTALLQFADTEPYAEWDGFARANAPVYASYRMLTETGKLNQNQPVRVVGEIGDVYLVAMERGIGYMAMQQVSKTRISSGGGSGDSSGGWTDPVL